MEIDMPKRAKDIAYIENRLVVTLQQADHSVGDCERASHAGLADLYRGQLAELRKDVATPNRALV
jgi:hypothetical protein